MKILHTEPSCGWGGQELRVLEEAAGMQARGHQVMIAAPAESRIYAEARKRGAPAVAPPIARKNLGALRALRRLLAGERPDILNTHSSTDTWLAALASVGLAQAPPLVRTRHISASIPRNAASRWLYRRATARVVTTGEALREQVMRETGLAPGRVLSVPTGVDLQRFSPGDQAAARNTLQLPAGVPLIGIVATLRSWKGHRFLVEAMAGAGMDGAHLVIVGDGPGRDNLRAQIDALGLPGRVRMAGNHADVVPWLRALDVFALPSYANEGVPQALMQAMAVGIPVVTTNVGAIGELVKSGETGLMVPPRDADALRTALLGLLHDPALRAGLSAAALAHVRAHFSRERMLDGMERVFAEVGGPGRGEPQRDDPGQKRAAGGAAPGA